MKIDWSEVSWRFVVAPLSGRWAPLYWAIFHLSMRLMGEVIAIGDTANPVVPYWLGASLTPLQFPMFYLWFPVGEWLKPHLTDNGVLELFAAIDALFWAHLAAWLLCRIVRGQVWPGNQEAVNA